jgi:hypothetical protein
VLRQQNRRAFWATVLTHAERDLRQRVKAWREQAWGFWLEMILLLSGVSGLVLWAAFGLPLWIAVVGGLAFVAVVIHEAAFRVWRDLETAVTGGGPRAMLAGYEEHISPIQATGAYRFSFGPTYEESREIVLGGVENRLPRAIRFESPGSKQLLKASDLPCVVKARDGLRRHRIIVHRFIPGGVVLDERDAPRGQLVCVVYFADPEQERSGI